MKIAFACLALACGLAMPGIVLADGNVADGERVFNRCKACHTVEQGGGNRVGPNLWGIFGAEAGQREIGFNFSKAMKASGIVWDEDTLDGYLENPREFMPRTRMSFPGLANAKQRENVIAYLRSVTQ